MGHPWVSQCLRNSMMLWKYSESRSAQDPFFKEGRIVHYKKCKKTKQSARCFYLLYKTFFLMEDVLHATENICTFGLKDMEKVLSPRKPNNPRRISTTCAEGKALLYWGRCCSITFHEH